MNHIRRFNESMDEEDAPYVPEEMEDTQGMPEPWIDDASEVHDRLLYNYGLHSDLEAYQRMKKSLNANIQELPKEAQDLMVDIDSTLESISGELREKIITLYNLLAHDDLAFEE